jgi:hypothetical protein
MLNCFVGTTRLAQRILLQVEILSSTGGSRIQAGFETRETGATG